ncbi:esterase B1-like [Contarinia nasturtii]|uniref:esterase B1-like n=1 Tax=Contarinia nasturtii TaxID=265458 RepID=UPI0012D3ADCC|nr:esterase B1-like [Contarinia nasturtii]
MIRKKMFKLLCELLSVFLIIPIMQCDPHIMKQTNNGPVEGIEQTGFLGRKYYAFRGVPYAEIPITGIDPYTGAEVDRRFKPTVPLTRRWTEALKVYEYADGCITSTKFLPKITKTSENCLFLNIYVPDGGSEKKTVMVYIHGGGFTEGTATDLLYGPDFLIEVDNIFVTLNYRLGIFGFMNLGFGEYTGNMGLKDQQVALKWIYENIEYFSGNKNEILLFGESAGGASVNYHMLNEESRKYFNRAFAMSSSALNFYALYEPNHLEIMQNFSNIQDKDKLIEHLKKEDSAILEQFRSTTSRGLVLLQSPWVPTIENSTTKGAFITESPEEIYKSKAPVMDTLFSFTSQEYVTFNANLTRNTEPFLSGNWNESKLLLPFAGFDKEIYPEEYKKAFEALKNAYFNDTSNIDAIKRGNIALLSDMNFGYNILKAVQYQVKANNKGNTKRNTFLQRFSVNADINLFKQLMQLNYDGASHGEDVCFICCCHLLNRLGIYEKNLIIKDNSNINYNAIMRMVNIVTNFAKTGNPSIEGDTPFKSSTSTEEIFSQDITNDSKTTLVTDIMDQLHFDTWKEIEDTYKIIKATHTE